MIDRNKFPAEGRDLSNMRAALKDAKHAFEGLAISKALAKSPDITARLAVLQKEITDLIWKGGDLFKAISESKCLE